jgi:hypothetical protein
MKHVLLLRTALLYVALLAGCATSYQPQGFTGGYSDFLTAPDEAVITFHGNGYTSAMRVIMLCSLHACDVTLQHGYRYFVAEGIGDLSTQSSFTTPGHAYTTGSAQGTYGGGFASLYGSSTTTYSPPHTFNIYKPGIVVSIKMANDPVALDRYGMFLNGQKLHPKDAAFLSASLRQYLGIRQ